MTSRYFTSLVQRAQARADEIGRHRARDVNWVGDGTQTGVQCVHNRRDGGQVSERLRCGLYPGGLLMHNGLDLDRTRAGRLFSDLDIGRTTSGHHKSGSKLATSETKQETWRGVRR